MEGRTQPDDFATAFESAFARLQVVLEMACVQEGSWSRRAVGAIHAALELAAAEPATANVLTNEALAEGADGIQRYERLMAYLAGLLEGGRAESPHGEELPETTERSVAGGVATIVGSRVGHGRREELLELAPEVVQFVLTPYLGTAAARRLAAPGDPPPGDPGR